MRMMTVRWRATVQIDAGCPSAFNRCWLGHLSSGHVSPRLVWIAAVVADFPKASRREQTRGASELPTIPEGCEFCPPGDMKSKGSRARVTKKLKNILSRNSGKKPAVKGFTKEVLNKAMHKELSSKPLPSKAVQAITWIGSKISQRSKIVPIVTVWDDDDWDHEAEGNLESCSCAGPLLCNPETSTGDKPWHGTKTNMAVKGRRLKYALTSHPVRLAKVCARKVRRRSRDGDFFNDIQNKDRFYEALGV